MADKNELSLIRDENLHAIPELKEADSELESAYHSLDKNRRKLKKLR